MNATQLFLSIVCDSSFLLFTVNLPSMYRKLSHGNVYKSCCCMGILISSLCPNVVLACTNCTCEFQSWLRGHRKLAHLQCLRYLPSQIFRTIKPNGFKKSTFVAESFFLDVLLSFLWIFLIVSALKIASFVDFVHSIQASHMASPYMQSNSNFFSTKIEQSTVLINNANRLVRNAPCDDWKVNDLCRRSRYLISWWYVWWKFMYRVYALVVAICTESHALNANNVYVDNIYWYIWYMPLSRLQYTFQWES